MNLIDWAAIIIAILSQVFLFSLGMNFNKKIMISLLEEVGKCNFDFEVSEDEIKKSIEYYNKLIS